MLKLINIKKVYPLGDESVQALKGINLEFNDYQFVSILGPSGCGKTTMLNIIGGLDKYTSGDLQIDNKTTKGFKDYEWDSYRNNEIGFVFQSYNLIPHLSVLENVSIALTLSGISVSERNERAKNVLERVGLGDQLKKRPNQLSGGQMQRVAIARALVNNPRILLADEPTGALDTKTSVQIMELLKEVSKERLVIMVTHNERLAESYSDRIIRLLDGEVSSDTGFNYSTDLDNTNVQRLRNKKTSMSFWTSLKISFKNLLTKKGRTLITALAGSIGILGIALVLSITNGMTVYVNNVQSEALSEYPLTISTNAMKFDFDRYHNNQDVEFPDDQIIYANNPRDSIPTHVNKIDQNYLNYLEEIDPSLYNNISYSYGVALNIVSLKTNGSYEKVSVGQASIFSAPSFNEIPNTKSFIDSQYDYLYGNFPTSYDQVALVVDRYNKVDSTILKQLGIDEETSYSFEDIIGQTLKVIYNDAYYQENEGVFTPSNQLATMYNDPSSITLTITSIMRVKKGVTTELLSPGFQYTSALTNKLLENAQTSQIVLAQIDAGDAIDVLTGKPFTTTNSYQANLRLFGADTIPTGIQIYPVNFDAKTEIKNYLDAYNINKPELDQIIYTDLAEIISNMTGTLINTIAIVLSAFAGISLVVSTIMIAIITYVSVLERTKEIGILRSIGARKKDISRLFSAETAIIGFTAGLIGIIGAIILNVPINIIIAHFVGVNNIAALAPMSALMLITLSVILTLIAGIFPSRFAARKDPVLALRTE